MDALRKQLILFYSWFKQGSNRVQNRELCSSRRDDAGNGEDLRSTIAEPRPTPSSYLLHTTTAQGYTFQLGVVQIF